MIVECKSCEALVDALILKDYSGKDYSGRDMKKMVRHISIAFWNVQKCNSPFLVVQEDLGGGWDDPSRLYPTQDIINPFYPEPIKRHIQRLKLVSKQKAYTAAAIMCRKTLEGICIEHKIKERNYGKLIKKDERS